ncbi:hypothetical protein M0R04_11375 [Candidatus Dojkabacteria bacterium]|jgi:hypothetical protein|nr:hypothetical protein [Candidatus Dojkabacteria bacterium]
MPIVCPFQDKPCKIPDAYFVFYSKDPSKRMCRLRDWRRKRATCSYDRTIASFVHFKKLRKDIEQKRLI